MAVTITIDNLDEFDISQLESLLGRTVEETQRQLFGERDDNADTDDIFYYNNKRACWLECIDRPNYFITDNGEVYREFENGNIKVVKPMYVQGQWTITLCTNAKPSRYNLSKLVARCFIPNTNNYSYVKFIDNNNNNLNVDNLEWTKNVTCRKLKDKMKVGRAEKPIVMCDMDGNEIEEFESSVKCELKYPQFSRSNICACLKGRIKKAYGYKWKYKY